MTRLKGARTKRRGTSKTMLPTEPTASLKDPRPNVRPKKRKTTAKESVQRTITMCSIPDADEEPNPYLRLFYSALTLNGIRYVGGLPLDRRSIRTQPQAPDWVHIHWPEHLVRSLTPNYIRFLSETTPGFWRIATVAENIHPFLKLHELKSLLRTVTARGTKLLWTVHNTSAHENHGTLEHQAYRMVNKAAAIKIFHGDKARSGFYSVYNHQGIDVLMRHGNYDGGYPAPKDKNEVRTLLGLSSDAPLFGLIGNLRANKGVSLVRKAAEALSGEAQFLCAGVVSNFTTLHELLGVDGIPSNLTIINRRLSDQEFSDYCSACDGLLFPYTNVATSGALMAALTFSRGVVVSNCSAFSEILTATELAGCIMDDYSAVALTAAIRKFLSVAPSRRGQAARSIADHYQWTKVVEPLVSALRQQTPKKT